MFQLKNIYTYAVFYLYITHLIYSTEQFRVVDQRIPISQGCIVTSENFIQN